MPVRSSRSAFTAELRQVLQHLYDPAALRRSPLAAFLGLADPDNPLVLQDALTKAIRTLKPASRVSPQSKAWRVYRTLTHRYIEQFSQQQVATTLGLSIRQMRRQERQALSALAEYLWAHYGLEGKESPSTQAADVGWAESENLTASTCEQELQWVEATLSSEMVDISETILSSLQVVAPLMRALDARVECSVPGDLPHVAAQRASIRQALLNIITSAVRAAPGDVVDIRASVDAGQVHVHVRPAADALAPAVGGVGDGLQVAQQLVQLSGGSLAVSQTEDGASPAIRLSLPVAEPAAVLVIDDNVDTLALLRRYLVDSRFPFVGCQDPEQALAMALRHTPRVIVLDVMLPGVDGWELLSRLREHPSTAGTPIIVCSILPQEQLALALGAAEFLQKPVSRDAMLAALARETGQLARESL